LRKIETLPGGGQANTFHDTVGVDKVWQAQSGDEWDVIHTVSLLYAFRKLWSKLEGQRDFNFEIRIPESVPPTIQLEKGGM